MSCKNTNSESTSLCALFAEILKSQILVSTPNLCAVTRARTIFPTIAGIPTRSPLAVNALFSFEPTGTGNTALNLGETVILAEEINPFISALRQFGIKITALHNHWLFDNPKLYYIHWFSVGDPIVFATNVAAAFTLLERDC